MDREALRTWGPVALVAAALVAALYALGRLGPAIGPREVAPVGSASCAECHPEEYAAWASSHHARAEGPVPAGFSGVPGVEEAPARTLGVDPLVQYLIPFDGGRLQVTQSAWDPAKAEWFDVFADDRQPGEWGHWTGGGMTWNSQCAGCHSTGVDKGWAPADREYHTTVAEHGVGCAACHGVVGPGDHGGTAVAPDLDECASCHARRSELTAAFVPGEAFLDHFAPQLVDETDAFWPDGQVREEDFEWTAFVSSKMHAAGVTCGDCHEPHSGQLRAEDVCAQCHAEGGRVPTKDHDPHAVDVGCVGCHMPVTTYMQRDPRHDHGFAVPDPVAQAELGIPDPCTRCHADRDAAWAAGTSAQWWPDLDPQRRARIRAMAKGRAGDAAAIPGLLAVLEADRPAFAAGAAAVLGRWVDRPEVRAELVAASAGPSELVRFAATWALAPVAPEVRVALEARLQDPVRAVRVQAARALRGSMAPTDPRAAEYVGYLTLHADSPAGLHERAAWSLERGEAGKALADLRLAAQWDPRSAPILEALALASARVGDAGGAASALRQAATLETGDPELWFRLALAEAGVQNLAGARAALERAVALEPGHVRAWYNLGLVRGQLGDPLGLDALRHAERLAPRDPEVAYAVASALWNAGDRAGAARQAERVLGLDPNHAGARQILAGSD